MSATAGGMPGASASRACGLSCHSGLVICAAEVGQGPVQQAGDVHLGDAEAGADLPLGEVAVEPQHQDALFAFGQLVRVGADGVDVDGVGDGGVVFAEDVAEQAGIALPDSGASRE